MAQHTAQRMIATLAAGSVLVLTSAGACSPTEGDGNAPAVTPPPVDTGSPGQPSPPGVDADDTGTEETGPDETGPETGPNAGPEDTGPDDGTSEGPDEGG
jgi:hypothetical protein